MNMHVHTLLMQMGDNAEEVAALLRRERVVGQPGNPQCCPVSRYLSDKTGQDYFVGGAVVVCLSDGRENAFIPLPVAAFVARFDQHDYPDLISPTPVEASA